MTDTVNDTYEDELDQQLDAERPEAWVPEQAGETIKGTVMGWETGTTKFGKQDICIIDTGEEVRSVWIMGSVLQNQFERVQPKIGERIGIRYLGKRQNEKGDNEYKDWKVVVSGRLGREKSWGDEPIPAAQAQQEADASGIVQQAAQTAIDRTPAKARPTEDETAPVAPTTASGLQNLRGFPATDMQLAEIRDLEVKLGREPGDYAESGVTRGEAQDYIATLKTEVGGG